MKEGAHLLFTHGREEGEIESEMFGANFYYSCLNKQEVHQLLEEAGFEIASSMEHYVERDMDRDLVILARKLHGN